MGIQTYRSFVQLANITLIQYWKGFDELLSYAHGNTHSMAWKAYNKKINNNGSVGVFHETYKIEKGASESIYNNMPKIGLSKAFSHLPVSKNKDSAIKRMAARSFEKREEGE